MMVDFHDSAQRAGEALAAAASVGAEMQSTGHGLVPCGSTTPEAATRGGRPVGLYYSIGSDRRGASRRARLLHRQRPEGGHPVGLRCYLSYTAPRSGGRSPSMRPPHVPHPPHEGYTEGGGSSAQGPATTDEARSYLDLFFEHLSCTLLFFVLINLCIFLFGFLLFRIYVDEENKNEKTLKQK
jgi:hypothetical protein